MVRHRALGHRLHSHMHPDPINQGARWTPEWRHNSHSQILKSESGLPFPLSVTLYPYHQTPDTKEWFDVTRRIA